MINTPLGEKDVATIQRSNSLSTKQFIAISERAIRKAICRNPGMALGVSAALGVFVACLIKRR